MKDNESILDFHKRASTLINQSRINGETMEEQKIMEKILRSLPTKFNLVFISIEEAKDLSTLSVDELMGSLQTHEQCQK